MLLYCVVMLSVVKLRVAMLSVVTLSGVRLGVAALESAQRLVKNYLVNYVSYIIGLL